MHKDLFLAIRSISYVPFRNYAQSLNSATWLERHVNDEYVKRARYENYRARSAYKLLEIHERFDLIKPGQVIMDLGAAPGSWTQAATRLMGLNNEYMLKRRTNKSKVPEEIIRNGFVLSVDLLPIAPVQGAVTLGHVDFSLPLNQAKIVKALDGRPVDVVLSDMAPNATGNTELDHDCIVTLAISTLQFATQVLRENSGALLVKLWDGPRVKEYQNRFLNKFFKTVRTVKPKASRTHSSELFLLAQNFRGLK